MKKLKLEHGLIALGGMPEEGKTEFLLKLSNQLAAYEKILLITYQDYSDKLYNQLSELVTKINNDLFISSAFDTEGILFYANLKEFISAKGVATVIIDDLYGYGSELCEENSLKGLKFICNDLNIRILIAVNTEPLLHDTIGILRPMLRSFKNTKNLRNICDQVLAIFRPAIYDYPTGSNWEPVPDITEVHNLKNKRNKVEVIKYDKKFHECE